MTGKPRSLAVMHLSSKWEKHLSPLLHSFKYFQSNTSFPTEVCWDFPNHVTVHFSPTVVPHPFNYDTIYHTDTDPNG